MKQGLLIIVMLMWAHLAFAQTASLPIQPGSTVSISATTSASAAALVPQASAPSWQLEIQNTGSVIAFCAFGSSAIAATTSDYPIMPGVDKVITVDQDRKYVSCITASSSTTVYVTSGVGE